MRTSSAVLTLALGLVAGGPIAACDDRPPTAPAPVISPTATPVLVRLEIVGPRSVAPGETVQFTAMGHFNNGSSRDLTNEVPWRASPPHALTVDSGGRVTGRVLGESTLHVQLNATAAVTEVVVVPRGTYRLSVVVREAGSFPTSTVEVTDATGARLVDTTSVNGRYDVYGVAGAVRLRVTAQGYREHSQQIVVADHMALEIEVAPTRPRVDVSGRFSLTIAAHEGCRSALPEELRVRRYQAQVTQRGPDIHVRLEGAGFDNNNHNYFTGRMSPESSDVSFFMFSYDYYYPSSGLSSMAERVGQSQFLSFSGAAATRIGHDSLSGIFDGSIQLFEVPQGRPAQMVAECRSRHPFLLSR